MNRSDLATVPLGERLTVRHRLPDGRATDVVGTLVARDRTAVTVRTRTGEDVRVDLAAVIVHRVVRPAPWRVATFLQRAQVAVLDLDGVVRSFDADGWLARAERDLGVDAGGLLELAFGLPEAEAMLVGRSTYDGWLAAVRARLLADGRPAHVVGETMSTWVADRGAPVAATVALVDELAARGTPTFVFTNGTDRVPAELEHIGLGHLVPWLINSADLGAAKPDLEAYAAAHARIEAHLGRTVAREDVRFTDDRPANVDAAREFGWQGRVFTHP
ncbi:hypothetical protein GCM10009584_12310 [Ornithinimicrobium humiphilum]|uniref:Putative hydrolase of the HAD superfamily n=1 Tax=Ornithinimicrobium humiphilum TaxID=125288 RepID=A0A543KJV1_9MICO|nr:HAD family hydrolase [Ornithinimicrobium humiphilum]TQM95334.1 putative hydrolase of the HAD superfamily [Ornithinimicrobium humiphilum]